MSPLRSRLDVLGPAALAVGLALLLAALMARAFAQLFPALNF